jgi:ribose/xylose/arabinose/galactoside ABC-type transport system permease subunit
MTTADTIAKKLGGALPLRRLLRDYGQIVILALATIIFAALEPAFVSTENLIGILYQISLIGIMAVCSTFVVISGGIDLSIGPVVALAGLMAAFALEATGLALAPALLAGIATGAGVGLLNGLAVARFDLPPIVVTLAMMSIVRGAALLIGGSVLHLIREPAAFLFVGSGRVVGLPIPIFIFVVTAAIMWFIQTRTSFGLSVFAIGENAAAARLCGLALTRVRTLAYLISGAGAGIAGVILAAQVRTASANYGNGIELDVIAAIVLGGTSLKGGSGAIYRSVIGALLIGGINNGLSILNVSTDLQLVAKGVIIVVAIALDNFLHRWSES